MSDESLNVSKKIPDEMKKGEIEPENNYSSSRHFKMSKGISCAVYNKHVILQFDLRVIARLLQPLKEDASEQRIAE